MRKIIFSPPDVDVRVFENVDSAIVDSLVVQLSKIKILVVKNYYCCGLILDVLVDISNSFRNLYFLVFYKLKQFFAFPVLNVGFSIPLLLYLFA